MRNDDYSPSRFQAQADAVSLICGAKTQSNLKNMVGILTMAGKGVRVLATPTSELGKILPCMHEKLTYMLKENNINSFTACYLDHTSTLLYLTLANLYHDLCKACSSLALKHRQNKNQQQRITVFGGRYVILAVDLLEEGNLIKTIEHMCRP
ncbi:hypothetical protein ES288_D04G066200v1 [Gossypium darwinii]|uniref:VWFA domain-containing protein n=1 Tax=Gossypium darwinii TaxID=34276 RepID=A0A5D2CWI9_GOSDA|nr:hypothetical protein ES288_D04G066200v1 [Gossypium darwinii]